MILHWNGWYTVDLNMLFSLIESQPKCLGKSLRSHTQNSSKLCIVVYDAPHAHLCCRNGNLRVFGKKHLNCQCKHIRTALIAQKDVGNVRMLESNECDRSIKGRCMNVCVRIKPNVYTGYGVKQHYLHRIIPRQLKNVYYKCILRQFEKRNCQGI